MMTSAGIRLKGVGKLKKKLQSMQELKEVQRIVKTNTVQMQNKTMRNMSKVYTGHMEGNKFVSPTGKTKGNTEISITNKGLTGIVGNNTEYLPYLENGTRFMKARPAVKPAFEAQMPKFVKQLKQLEK